MNHWRTVLLAAALALAGYAAVMAQTRSSVTHRTVAYGLGPVALAKAYLVNQAGNYEENIGTLKCHASKVELQKVAVTCVEHYGTEKFTTIVDLFHSTWQIAPTT